MNTILSQIDQKILSQTHKQRLPRCTAWKKGSFLQLVFSSSGCRYRSMGCCTMCDYGQGCNLDVDTALSSLEKAWNRYGAGVDELLLGSCGSVLDEQEISKDVLTAILEFVQKHPVNTLLLETHYTTVTAKRLEFLRQQVPSVENIVIELGLESANEWVLNSCINKYMDLDQLKKKIDLIHEFGMNVTVNVFLGAPFLSVSEQLQDTIHTVLWAKKHNADNIVIFPANIKENTLLGYLYRTGRYQRPSAWQLAELLRLLPKDVFGMIELSWYGDRQKKGVSTESLPPQACDQCETILLNFFDAFSSEQDPRQRFQMLDTLFSLKNNCSCYAEFRKSCGYHRKQNSTSHHYRTILQQLKKEFQV